MRNALIPFGRPFRHSPCPADARALAHKGKRQHMTTLNNPFVVYGYKGAAYFCDREKETGKLIATLTGERNVTLVAPRRMGKTGLIKHVFCLIEQQDAEARCFYLDIYATKNLEQLVQLLAQTIVGQLDTLTQQAIRRIQEFFGSWRPTFSIDPQTGMPTVSLDIHPKEESESLRRIFEYMRQSGRRCYVAIDEFQQVLSYPESGVEALIRSYIQFLPNVYFVFSGSQQHMMQEMFLSANRPFFQSSMVMSLGCIDPQVYRTFANTFFAEQGRNIDEATFDALYNKVKGTTWYVQAILHALFEHRSEQMDTALVDNVVSELLDEQSTAYQNYCAWLTDNQLTLLQAIAREGSVEAPLSQSFAKRHNLPATSSIKTALKALCDRQLVVRNSQGYELSDIFFALWIARGM